MMADSEERGAAGVVGNLIAQNPGRAIVGLGRMAGLGMRVAHGDKVANALSDTYTLGLQDPHALTGYLLNLMSRQPRPSYTGGIGAAIGGQMNAESYTP
jgi:hypothetical protein